VVCFVSNFRIISLVAAGRHCLLDRPQTNKQCRSGDQILTLGVPIPNFACDSTPTVCAYTPNFRFIVSRSRGENPQIFPHCQIQHSVTAPLGSAETKLNANAQLQTFPYPLISKLFPYSNFLMAKLLAQTLPFKKRGGQTKNKHQTFTPSRGGVKFQPAILDMEIEEVSTIFRHP